MPTKPVGGSEAIDTNEDLVIQHVAIVGVENIVFDQRLCDQCRTLRLSSDELEGAISTGTSQFQGIVPTRYSYRIGGIYRAFSPCCPFCRLVQESLKQKEISHYYNVDLEIERISPGDAGLVSYIALRRYQFSDGWLSITLPSDVYGTSLINATGIRLIDTSSINWRQVREWIQQCDEEHVDDCAREKPSEALIHGFRVIDCETRNIVPCPAGCEYVALSYVWGSRSILLPSSPQLSDAPSTIEDAIICTRALGFQYLWVDRYCIDQNDLETKHGLIQRMDQIYQDASLTIINAAGEGPDCGLPGVSGTPRRLQSSVTIGGVTFSTIPDAKAELDQCAWASRGWTYQEGLLSRRRLIFGPSQVAFQCLRMCSCESITTKCWVTKDYGNSAYDFQKLSDGIQSLPGPLEIRGSRIFHASPLFRGIYLGMRINEYLKKSLSYESDTLNAFMGVLRYVWLLSVPTYHFWGVPFGGPRHPFPDDHHDGHFLTALFWVQGSEADAKASHYSQVSRREGFPSWTWAGWRGIRAIVTPGARELEGTVSLRDLNDTPFRLRDYVATMQQSWNMYGFKPLLHVTGWFAMIRIEVHEKGTGWVAVGADVDTDRSTTTVPFADVEFMAEPLEVFRELRSGNNVADMRPAIIFTPIEQNHYIRGLLLKSVDDGAFERVGKFTTDERDFPGQTQAHATTSRTGNDIEFVIPALRGCEGRAKVQCKWSTIKLV